VSSSTVTRIVTDDQLEQFKRDGFIMIPDLLTPEEVERFGTAVTEGVKWRTKDHTVPLEERSNYQKSFLQCMNLWEDRPDVAPLTFHPKVCQAAAELMEVDACRVWHDQALYKEAHGRQTDAHQDHPYWPIKEINSVTAWIPFVRSTLENGALGYLPGSHAIGLRKFVNIFFGEPEKILEEPEFQAIEPVFLEVPPGSVAFHHGLTVHLAGANNTDVDRAVHTIIFFPDGSTRGYPFPHFSVDRGGIEVGQKIDSDATPIAWPRPADEPIPPLPAVDFSVDQKITNSGSVPRR
jgi:ectoine hydroxylase-related dioxygenase (phytanoyl-CoA dioxygenase family)